MQVLVVAGQKGGSGRTTLSGHLAVQAERCKDGPVALFDYDPQRGLAAWWDQRKAETPVLVRAPALKELSAAIVAVAAQGFNLLIIDTPPVVTDLIRDVMAYADLIITPVRPSPHDLRAVGATIDLADQAKRQMVFVVSQAVPRTKLSSDAIVALSQHGPVAPAIIHTRIDYASSMADGRTVQEVYPLSKSATEIAELWQYIKKQLKRRAKANG